jgi:hypothetical protein
MPTANGTFDIDHFDTGKPHDEREGVALAALTSPRPSTAT